jgi:hypothetical protein
MRPAARSQRHCAKWQSEIGRSGANTDAERLQSQRPTHGIFVQLLSVIDSDPKASALLLRHLLRPSGRSSPWSTVKGIAGDGTGW